MDEHALGDRELDVMAVLWEIGSGTVGEVRQRLPAHLAYTTVLTILRNLEAKGYLSHTVEGRAHRYAPRIAQRTAQKSALSHMLSRLFQGSPELLLARLVETEALTPDELRDLAKRVSSARKPKGRAC
ncbi:MAG: BlaI family transcriptional regulator [Gemmatimonas sp.]|nr:BlaI family transcriptional regulator [Gemmatimonas sp.]